MIKTPGVPDLLDVIILSGKAKAHHLRWAGRSSTPLCGYEPQGRYHWQTLHDVELESFRGFGGWWRLCQGCEREAEKLGGLVAAE